MSVRVPRVAVAENRSLGLAVAAALVEATDLANCRRLFSHCGAYRAEGRILAAVAAVLAVAVPSTAVPTDSGLT
ncbi:hypothetical protein NJB18091_50650 [Mycobacterium marinum]|nr:hypothetical protein NJB18091_50650 [Mycobacterium marinum]